MKKFNFKLAALSAGLIYSSGFILAQSSQPEQPPAAITSTSTTPTMTNTLPTVVPPNPPVPTATLPPMPVPTPATAAPPGFGNMNFSR